MAANNPADDWKIWLVVNPATWLVPIWFTVLFIVISVHKYVLGLPGLGWN